MPPKPNLFKIATKELSQDALLAWLLEWANPQVAQHDAGMHACGAALLQLLAGNERPFSESILTDIVVERQWESIDVCAELYFENGSKLLLIIEDKVFANEHSGQLERYHQKAQDWCDEHGFALTCAYVKIGSEPVKTLNAIREKGYRVYDRSQLIAYLTPFQSLGNHTLNDFIEHLQDLQAAHEMYATLPIGEWKKHRWTWVGFYQFIEANRKINTWHRVNNPAGGFWNLCLNWEYWGEFPVYMQIEEHKICFKVAVTEEETELKISAGEANAVQDFVQAKLLNFAAGRGETRIERPWPYVHRGDYRTFAVIGQEAWLGSNDAVVDTAAVLRTISDFVQLYDDFIAELHEIDFRTTGLLVSSEIAAAEDPTQN